MHTYIHICTYIHTYILLDCTVKVWDLSTGLETVNLTRHHSYVRKVTYSPTSQLVFTACQSLIKLWDLRDMNKAQFVKTLLVMFVLCVKCNVQYDIN